METIEALLITTAGIASIAALNAVLADKFRNYLAETGMLSGFAFTALIQSGIASMG